MISHFRGLRTTFYLRYLIAAAALSDVSMHAELKANYSRSSSSSACLGSTENYLGHQWTAEPGHNCLY